MNNPLLLLLLLMLISCNQPSQSGEYGMTDTAVLSQPVPEVVSSSDPVNKVIKVSADQRDSIVSFAASLMGTPYKYGSIDPAVGFDCSGFITYVFKHFNISVPRSSVDFTNVGKEVPVTSARRGDLILFTGTDSTERFVGHMGIVESNVDSLRFLHSTSGKCHSISFT